MTDVETRSIDEREKAVQEYNRLNDLLLEATKKNNQLLIDEETKRLMGTKGVNEKQAALLIEFVRNYDEITDKQLDNVRKVWEWEEKAKKAQSKEWFYAQAKKVYETLSDEEKAWADLGAAMNKTLDEERDNIANALISYADAQGQYETANKTAQRRAQQLQRERIKGLQDETTEVYKLAKAYNDFMQTNLESVSKLIIPNIEIKVPKLKFDEEELDIFDPIEQEAIEHANWMRDWATSLNASIHSLLVDGLVDSFDILGTAIGSALSGKAFNGGEEFLMLLADWAKRLGAILVAAGLAVWKFQTEIAINPLAVAGLGAALIVAGAAVKAVLADTPSTGVNSTYGGSSGAGSDLMGLRQLKQFEILVSGEIVAQGSNLVAVINNENKRNTY
jgi:hypothetical protein